MLHRQDKPAGPDPTKDGGKAATVPNEVADEVGADCPRAKDQPALAALEQRDQDAKEAIDFARRTRRQAAAQRVLHVFSVRLADAQDDPLHLGKIVKARGHNFAKPCAGGAGAAPQALIHRGRCG